MKRFVSLNLKFIFALLSFFLLFCKNLSADQEKKEDEKPVTGYMAVVIDDMGISAKRSREIIKIDAPLTLSFLTYAENLRTLCKENGNLEKEVMIHVPMEPQNALNLAPDTLMISMSDEEIEENFLKMLSKFDGLGVKGVNNHMGSLFTQSAAKLDVVMRVLKEKNLFFLDSKTSKYSKAQELADLDGVLFVARDVFLDNENDYDYIIRQLKKTEKIALKKGYAVAIGHPKSQTVKALKAWVETGKDKNVELLGLSKLMEKKAQNTKK